MPPPVTDAERDRIRQLHADGKTLSEVARDLGRSRSTISKYAADMGLAWDRAQTRAATEAHVVDAKARRAQLMVDLLGDAQRLRHQLWAPWTVHAFGGRDNTYNEHDVDEPPAGDKLKLMQAAGTAIDRSLRLDRHDADEHGLAAVDAWLQGMLGDQ